MEAEYLKRTVGGCLAEGLAEVSAKRPSDPIEYLALWILKHKQSSDQREQTEVEEVELSLPTEERLTAASTEGQQQREDPQPAVVSSEEPQGAASGGDGEETTGDGPKPSDPVPVPTVSLEVEKISSAGKLSRIEEEKEEELAREGENTVEVPVQEKPPDET